MGDRFSPESLHGDLLLHSLIGIPPLLCAAPFFTLVSRSELKVRLFPLSVVTYPPLSRPFSFA